MHNIKFLFTKYHKTNQNCSYSWDRKNCFVKQESVTDTTAKIHELQSKLSAQQLTLYDLFT